jgi:hypothetical protein
VQQELSPLDVSNLPQLEEAAEEVRATGKSRRIVRGKEELAVLRPTTKSRRTRLPGKPVTDDDPFWSLIGVARSSGPGDISANKRKYLLKAIAPRDE